MIVDDKSEGTEGTDDAIRARGLRKTYADGWLKRRKFEALRGIDLTVPRGKVFGLLGPNGAGKTTFVKILLGIVSRTAGSASILDIPAEDRKARHRIGYLPENLRVRRHHTANTALEYFGGLSGLSPGRVKQLRGGLLERVGLADWATESVRKYSKGMLQRLGLAQALLHDPELLILDEPTDGLDPQARADVREIMLQLKNDGKTVFLNSHILQEVEMVCDEVAILQKGILRYCGPVRQIGSFIESTTGIRTGQGMVFVLQGTPEEIRNRIDLGPEDSLDEVEPGRLEWSTPRCETEFVNQAIDRLRAGQIMIVEATRRNVSLEQAFLQILAADGNEAESGTQVETTTQNGEAAQ